MDNLTAQQLRTQLEKIVADMALRRWCIEKAIEARINSMEDVQKIYEFVTKPAFDAITAPNLKNE